MIHVLLPGPAEPGATVVTGAAAHHLTRVLRARPGEAITAADGHGGRHRGTVAEVARGRVVLELGPATLAAELTPRLHMLVPLLPADRMALMVEKLVEGGAAIIQSVATSRSRKGDPTARMVAVARAATEQSRRAWLADVRAPLPLADALAAAPAPVLAADTAPGCRPLSGALDRATGPEIALASGPEGGFDERDRAVLDGAGAVRVTLGPSVLRAETAPLVLLSACALRHGLLDASLSP